MNFPSLLNRSYLFCIDHELGWGNRTYFTWFSEFKPSMETGGSTSHARWLTSMVESSVLVLLFVLSTLTNGTVFYTLCSNRRLRTVTNYLVCNLTLADGCFTLCCPLVAVVRFTGAWTLGSFACKTVIYLSVVCGFVTIWTLTLISIDRYMCIVRSSKRRITPPVALVLIAVVWVLTLIAFTPLLLYFVVKDCPYGNGVVSICTLGWPRTPGIFVSIIFTSIVCGLGFIVPVVTLVVSHAAIFIKVRKVQIAMSSHRQRQFSTSDANLFATHAPWDRHHNNGFTIASNLNDHVFSSSGSTGVKQKWPLTSHLRRANAVHNLNQRGDARCERLGLFLESAPLMNISVCPSNPLQRRLDNLVLSESPDTSSGIEKDAGSSDTDTAVGFVASSALKPATSVDVLAQPQAEQGQSLSPVLLDSTKLPAYMTAVGSSFFYDLNKEGGLYYSTQGPSTSASDKQSYLSTMQSPNLWSTRLASALNGTLERRTRRRTISVANPNSSGSGVSRGSNASSNFNSLGRQRQKRREIRVVKTLLLLVLLFLVMWAPIFVVLALLVVDGYQDVVSSSIFLGAACLAYCNAVLNPLAYGLSTERIRIYLRSAVLCCCSGKKRPMKSASLPALTPPRGSQRGSLAVWGPETSYTAAAVSRRNSRKDRAASNGRVAGGCCPRSVNLNDDQQSSTLRDNGMD